MLAVSRVGLVARYSSYVDVPPTSSSRHGRVHRFSWGPRLLESSDSRIAGGRAIEIQVKISNLCWHLSYGTCRAAGSGRHERAPFLSGELPRLRW